MAHTSQPRVAHATRNDDGLTLMEMVVAVGILMVVLLASLGVFLTVQKAQQVAEGTDRATQLANSRIERIRQLGWSDIGFYQNTYTAGTTSATKTDTKTTAADYNPYLVINGLSETTAIVGTTEVNTGDSIIDPYEVTQPDEARNKFTVYTTITYGRNSSLGLPTTSQTTATNQYSFKRVRVTVVWKDNNNGQTHKVVNESWFAPQGFEEAPPGVTVTSE